MLETREIKSGRQWTGEAGNEFFWPCAKYENSPHTAFRETEIKMIWRAGCDDNRR